MIVVSIKGSTKHWTTAGRRKTAKEAAELAEEMRAQGFEVIVKTQPDNTATFKDMTYHGGLNKPNKRIFHNN